MHINLRKLFLNGLCIMTLGLFSVNSYSSPVECNIFVKPEKGKCTLILKVSNITDEEICLEFSSGQQYDYIVKNMQGEEIWQWSEGQVFIFMQMLQQLFISPGCEHTFPQTWQYIDKTGNPIKPGTYMVSGILTTAPNPIITEWVEIEIPASYIPEKLPIRGKITKILDKLYLLGEDGTAYHIESPTEELYQLRNETVEVTSYEVQSIPGTVDKKIIIEDYAI